VDAKQKILLVEDEPHLAFSLQLNLEEEGFEIIHTGDGAKANDEFLTRGPFAAVILDVMLPGKDGFAIAKDIRESDSKIGILMLTARAGDLDRLRGFDVGVDDYIAKPFHLQELLARVKRMTARAQLLSSTEAKQPSASKIAWGDYVLDSVELTLVKGQDVETVTDLEAKFLAELFMNAGKVVSREHLLKTVWGLSSQVETRTIDNFVVRLRKLLESDPKNPQYLTSVRGKGYRLEVHNQNPS
jgi:DNA-binding response OmpR family regulator